MNNQSLGLSGLQNLGNTCFLNSAMQCFSHTNELNNLLDNAHVMNKINNKPEAILLKEWNELRELLWKKNCIITPGGFVHNVQQIAIKLDNDNFTGWAQNDLPEFIYFMMNGFHNALAREVDINITGNTQNKRDRLAKIAYTTIKEMYSKEYSEMIPLFFGVHFSTICSLDGKTEKLDLPNTNLIIYYLEDNSRISVRPSGTEPKIKFYVNLYSKFNDSFDLNKESIKLEKKSKEIIKYFNR